MLRTYYFVRDIFRYHAKRNTARERSLLWDILGQTKVNKGLLEGKSYITRDLKQCACRQHVLACEIVGKMSAKRIVSVLITQHSNKLDKII